MSIAENLARIEEGITAACSKSARSREDVQLIAVSKTKPVDLVAEAIEAGQLDFGENRVQELIEKAPAFPESVHWHLIGHLQKNKIRKVLPHCAWLHTIDSVKLAQQVDRISGELALKTRALLQVNIAKDEAKFGFTAEEVLSALEEILILQNLEIAGLMTIPEFDPDPEKTRVHFANLRELRDELESGSGVGLPHLSMGMSHDFPVAIEEGATFVRVGTSIFGKRE